MRRWRLPVLGKLRGDGATDQYDDIVVFRLGAGKIRLEQANVVHPRKATWWVSVVDERHVGMSSKRVFVTTDRAIARVPHVNVSHTIEQLRRRRISTILNTQPSNGSDFC